MFAADPYSKQVFLIWRMKFGTSRAAAVEDYTVRVGSVVVYFEVHDMAVEAKWEA